MRGSLRWRLVASYVSLVIICIGGLGLVLYIYMQQTYLDLWKTNLFSDARLISSQAEPFLIEGPPYDNLNSTMQKNGGLLGLRITIMLPDGNVVSESSIDPAELKNHLNRPEVQAALRGNEDSEIRLSDTLKKEMLYAAVPIRQDDRIIGVARLAISLDKIHANLAIARQTIIIGSLLTTFLAAILAILVTSYIISPLNKLSEAVAQITKGDLPEISPSQRMDEVGNLDRAFNAMSHQVHQQLGELRAQHETLTSVLSHMTDGILIADQEGMIRLINPAAQQIFNVDETGALDHRLIEVVRHHQLAEIWRKCQMSGTPQSTTLETIPDRLFIQGIATPLGSTMPGSTLLVFQDLTLLRRLEMIRRDFVSNVSHELRTPLASLKALTETLSEGALEDPPAAKQFLKRMEDEIDNMTQMVQELLELSKIESGRVPLEKRAITPYELIQPAIDRMQLQAERAGLTLTLDCGRDLPAVLADPNRMEQVLVNLVHNAIKFTPPGGEILVSAHNEPGKVVFMVRDTGVGIEPEALTRIFERFYKADRSRSGGGTGLGLSIARHLVESHGGHIWAESNPGQGSTFYFSLPIAKD